MEPNFQDLLGWSDDKEILKVLGKENIYFSNKVYKINHYKQKQERNLILTNNCLYNFKNKKLKREIKYKEMIGITFSNQSNEFVVHAKEGNDFYYISPDKNTIIYIIAKFYEKLLKKQITLCEINDKTLKQYATGKKDKKKSNTSKLDLNNKIDTRTFLIDNNPVEVNRRTFTNKSDGRMSSLVNTQENPKNINSELIFCKDEKVFSISFENFEIINIIGRGFSGKVFLAKNKLNNEYYALKSVSKNIFEINENSKKNIKKLSIISKFPFLIDIFCCFLTDERIYFASPYVQGEELFYNIKINRQLDEEKIKFYTGIIGLSLDFLHSIGIIYKSFNSKNIIIDKNGYLKITPFHIEQILELKNNKNKKLFDHFRNEYSPPELFLEENQQNIQAADWWNLGIIIFEMIYGIPPFFSDDDNEMKNKICQSELKFPKNPTISENLKDLINKLLNKKCQERLGYQNGFEEIKNHIFFKNYNFDELLEKKIEPIYKPIIGKIIEGNKTINEKYTFEDLQKVECLELI